MNNLSFGKGRGSLLDTPFPKIFQIMKITTALMLIFMTCAYGSGKAQKVSLSLRNAKLEDAFKEISRQTKYKFLYNDALLKNARLINLNVVNENLSETMSKLLSNNGMVYKIIDETININASEDSNAPIVAKGNMVQEPIKGTVKDEDGKPLPGASIVVKGTTITVSTNEKGEFSINAPANAILIIRFIGYKQKEVAIANRKSIAVQLDSDNQMLNSVNIVSTGYQNLDRKLFTGAATRVSAKDVERAGVPDITRMLEGQVAGVSIQNVSGTFGAAPKIRVRGATSISGDNKPLWVIDGIILEDVVNISNEALSTGDPNTLIGSSVAGLNPDDIESFNILKDAAATAMYGARAMNGVIVVTTKKR
jgi:TonB-dependent SusC/RagA subfamily outer membrane receptor